MAPASTTSTADSDAVVSSDALDDGASVPDATGASAIALVLEVVDGAADDDALEASATPDDEEACATEDDVATGACGAPPSIRVMTRIATMTTSIAANAAQPMSFCLAVLFANSFLSTGS